MLRTFYWTRDIEYNAFVKERTSDNHYEKAWIKGKAQVTEPQSKSQNLKIKGLIHH